MTFEFTVEEVNVILQALGNAPYAQVFQVVAKLQQQAQTQLSSEPAPVPTPLSAGVN